jgi:hypothetical protein
VLCGYIAHHKTAAVQELLLACPRKAKEVAVVERLMQYQPHEALTALEKEAELQSAYAVIDGQVRQFAAKLGFAVEADKSVWAQFPRLDASIAQRLYRGIFLDFRHELRLQRFKLSWSIIHYLKCTTNCRASANLIGGSRLC